MTDCKLISFEIHYSVNKRNCYVDVLRKAELTFDWDTELNSVFKFMKDLAGVLHSYKYCAKKGERCKVTLSIGRYTHAQDQVVTESFDYWIFDDFADDETGFYLRADERYTSPDRDIWFDLTRPLQVVLEELSI